MHYRILGQTGLRASVIGVGTWQFGGEWGRDFSQAEADAILDAAADCGWVKLTPHSPPNCQVPAPMTETRKPVLPKIR